VAEGLVKRFGGRAAVDGVDLVVPPGARVAVVGPNGAGKSTLLRMAATLLRPDAGSLRVGGHPCPAQVRRARAVIGYLGHDPLVYLDLTAWQNLDLFGSLYGVRGLRDGIPAALSRVGLLPRAHDPVRTFSRGMAQRLGIARMLMHDPPLLLLDEPYTGLDAEGGRLLDRVIGDLGGDRAVVLVTHELGRAVSLAGNVLMLRRGRLVLDTPTTGLSADGLASRYAELAG
jgi:heme exporter protein A